MKNFSTPDGKFDLTKIYRDNLHYPRSSLSKGLQIADIAASTIHHAVCGVATLDNLMNYGLLLKNNLSAPKYAHGLFCLTDESYIDYNRYAGLNEAVAKAREAATSDRPRLFAARAIEQPLIGDCGVNRSASPKPCCLGHHVPRHC